MVILDIRIQVFDNSSLRCVQKPMSRLDIQLARAPLGRTHGIRISQALRYGGYSGKVELWKAPEGRGGPPYRAGHEVALLFIQRLFSKRFEMEDMASSSRRETDMHVFPNKAADAAFEQARSRSRSACTRPASAP